MRKWIRANREALDAFIKQATDQPDMRLNDDERALWVLNDEFLYNCQKRGLTLNELC